MWKAKITKFIWVSKFLDLKYLLEDVTNNCFAAKLDQMCLSLQVLEPPTIWVKRSTCGFPGWLVLQYTSSNSYIKAKCPQYSTNNWFHFPMSSLDLVSRYTLAIGRILHDSFNIICKSFLSLYVARSHASPHECSLSLT